MQQLKQADFATFRTGKTDTVELNVGQFNTRLWLEIEAEFTNGGAAPVGPNAFASILGIIQSSRIILDDDSDFQRMTGLDLAARYVGDYGYGPTKVPALPMAAASYKAIFPIDLWLQNSSTPQLCGLDLRGKKMAKFEISFGSIQNLYDDAGGMAIERLTVKVIQEVESHYKPAYRIQRKKEQGENAAKGKEKDITQRPINAFCRDYKHYENVFDGPKNGVELGRIKADEDLISQGFMMYAHNGMTLEDLITGEITITQGTRTIGVTTPDMLAARMAGLNFGHNVDQILQHYWHALLDNRGDIPTHKFKDEDIVIRGNVSAACQITTKHVGYRQER